MLTSRLKYEQTPRHEKLIGKRYSDDISICIAHAFYYEPAVVCVYILPHRDLNPNHASVWTVTLHLTENASCILGERRGGAVQRTSIVSIQWSLIKTLIIKNTLSTEFWILWQYV